MSSTTGSSSDPQAGARRRRVRLRPEERRELLLDAASAAFLAQGYGATSLRDIATRADVTPGLIYRYFPGKYEMLVALVNERGPAKLLTLLDEPWEHLSLRELLAEAVRQIVTALSEHRETVLIMQTQRLTDADIAALIAEQLSRSSAAVAAYLTGWSARGLMRQGTESSVAWSLMALAQSFFLENAVPPENLAPSAATLDRFAEEAADLLVLGCRPD